MLLKAENGYNTFYKDKNADFKILLMTDLHIGCGIISKYSDKKAEAAMLATAKKADADLIILNGDLTYPIAFLSGSTNNKKQAERVSSIMDKIGKPWALVFGNHDEEKHSQYDKHTLAEIYMKNKNCLFQKGPDDIDGVGNYIINIKNADGKFNTALVMLDSNQYLKRGYLSGFDHVHDNQIEWYKDQIKKLSVENGRLVPSLMFFHIPVKEFADAWRKLYLGEVGTDENGDKEIIYHFGFVNEKDNYFGHPVELKTHLFDDVLALGSTKGIFMGHDHLNTLSLTYKGVRLTYPMSIDYIAYIGIAKKKTQRGGTLITIDDSGKFEIKHLPLWERDI
ncbi:MAG: metallophosphoesterase [Clostridiales bacterium]|jgi:metallophosphoesterase superfamily enzyme|nr:metallophosphoesterase [Clostridiales bacterium]